MTDVKHDACKQQALMWIVWCQHVVCSLVVWRGKTPEINKLHVLTLVFDTFCHIVPFEYSNNNNKYVNLYGVVTRPYRYKCASQATKWGKP